MLAGVDISPSMVPRSHSLEMTKAVSRVPIIVMMMAMPPGISTWRLFNSGLYQKRCCTMMRPAAADLSASQLPSTPWA